MSGSIRGLDQSEISEAWYLQSLEESVFSFPEKIRVCVSIHPLLSSMNLSLPPPTLFHPSRLSLSTGLSSLWLWLWFCIWLCLTVNDISVCTPEYESVTVTCEPRQWQDRFCWCCNFCLKWPSYLLSVWIRHSLGLRSVIFPSRNNPWILRLDWISHSA